jgi:hypothetical protein
VMICGRNAPYGDSAAVASIGKHTTKRLRIKLVVTTRLRLMCPL